MFSFLVVIFFSMLFHGAVLAQDTDDETVMDNVCFQVDVDCGDGTTAESVWLWNRGWWIRQVQLGNYVCAEVPFDLVECVDMEIIVETEMEVVSSEMVSDMDWSCFSEG